MILLFSFYLFFIAGLFWAYGGYLCFIIAFSAIFKKKNIIDVSYTPAATIIMPTYNEEVVIAKKLEDILSQDYPKEKLQIIVVDSGSADKTREIVNNYSGYGIELVEQPEREGKGSAIQHGLNFAKHEIIVVTDANSYFEPGALKYLLRNFSDPRVGGVTGRYFGKNIKDNAQSQGGAIFRDYENILRRFETRIDSAVSLFGEIFAVRKSLLFIDEGNLTEDFESSVGIRRKGHKLIYEPGASVYEYMPCTEKDLVLQRKRVIIGTIQTLLKYKSMLFNPKYGFYGLLILPGHKLVHILSPFLLAGFFITSLAFWKISFILILCALIFIKITLISARKKVPLLGLSKYFILINICCLSAWKDYLLRRYTIRWEKMESSRYLNGGKP